MLLFLLLSFLPDLFLWVANFGSGATSLVAAENAALQMYWYFMVLFAIISSSIARMGLDAYRNGSFDWFNNLSQVARTVPVSVSSTWTNWIILKSSEFRVPYFHYAAEVGTHKACLFMFPI